MNIVTVLGTRPEIIRLSLIIKKLDQLADKHILVHTGQNFTPSLSNIFFEQLKLRKPNYVLSKKKQVSLGEQLSTMFSGLEKVFHKEKPDKVLVLGDTNSGLGAILAERMGIPVFHMEAGNRCFDLNVPEEVNRKVIDAVSSINLPYTQNSKENLLREGIPKNRIYVTGNPIYEVLNHYSDQIKNNTILEDLHLVSKDYILVTTHRAENVDNRKRLVGIMNGLNKVADTYKKRIICSLHPRTASKLDQSIPDNLSPFIEFHEPFGFFDFVQLEKNASLVLTDSGTVQEECCIFQVPAVTIRTTTERPETIECGSNILSGIQSDQIFNAVNVMINRQTGWTCPEGYTDPDVSDKVLKLLLGGIGVV
ncbi:UDP-N-acetylglucosamine 2-epimerase (non-hydrolyzing) [Pueribacillus theae]|uniref:UDP-N-acetylglucosamine 2-epimerase (Non-hydrolyzing) n=1 Tax=Pueribacillus theae TaxID=2171751 RepID=A0A2U1K5D9_9BACI|nr:UDP-N-acetylglucosamine 2-epimerase (non-hydrolyzing) [Pueribacillus theae]PWA12720.1 UDP-N-acetylglucosamine 2-epimerase (non-hydrolyzing) [Pueribacillus theae]